MKRRIVCVLLAGVVGCSTFAAASAETFRRNVAPLIEASCVSCHDSDTETGFNLEALGDDLTDAESFRAWEKVFDRVKDGEMPPPSEDRPAPDHLELALQSLKKSLHAASYSLQQREGRVPARRLTKLEYGWTIRDLLLVAGDAATDLPAESDSGSFDTIGSSQRISDVHMKSYLKSAEDALSVALNFGPNPYRDHRFDIPNSPRLAYHDGKDFLNGGGHYRRAGEGVILFTSAEFLLPSHAHGFDVPMPGRYQITIEADAYQSKTPVIMKVISKANSGPVRLLEAFDVQPGKPQTFQVMAELIPGDSFYPLFVFAGDSADWDYIMNQGEEDYTGSGLAIRSYRVRGPLFEQWPPPSTRRLLTGVQLEGEPGSSYQVQLTGQPREHLRTIVQAFSQRAFRRPPSKKEVDGFVELAREELENGAEFVDALRVPLRSILSSPQFLMFEMTPGKLDDYALASRLSYFLWRSTPDEELLQLASKGKLSDQEVLRQQVERLLHHERAARFVDDFLGQWLRLYKINATTPDSRLYWEYDELLGNSLVKETEAFFSELIQRNLPARNLIDSDFTFLNQRLAEHYRIPGVEGHHFRRVELPEESVRGGVLTQASVLKTTANGSVTSPVIRGNFVLTNFFGTPPPPPPPSAGSIEPDTRGTTTIREQLAAHREVESCNRCHRQIDPPGFALESFDPIGAFRTRYRAFVDGQIREELVVDASGVSAEGKAFSNIREFKEILLEHEEGFATNLITQLVVFSTGGEIQFADREEIAAIANKTRDGDFRLRDIIHVVVQSRLFRDL